MVGMSVNIKKALPVVHAFDLDLDLLMRQEQLPQNTLNENTLALLAWKRRKANGLLEATSAKDVKLKRSPQATSAEDGKLKLHLKMEYVKDVTLICSPSTTMEKMLN